MGFHMIKPITFDQGVICGAVTFRKVLCRGWFITGRVLECGKYNSCLEDSNAVTALKGLKLDMVVMK